MSRRVALVLLLALVAGCAGSTREPDEEPSPSTDHRVLGDLPGLERVVRLTPDVYRGARPVGDEGMASLEELGVRAILSVDSSEEEARRAEAHGIAYHEVPLDYRGWSDEEAARILEVYESAPGPIYVHCHQGKHRAGSAAAIYRIGIQGWSNERAERELAALGCSPRYEGIYEATRTWRPGPSSDGREEGAR